MLVPYSIRFLDAYLKPTDIALEWGSGVITIWFAKRIGSLTSVENNPLWHDRISNQLERNSIKNTTLLLRISDESYVGAADDFQEDSLDFVLVDGRWRGKCVDVIMEKIRPGGILVIDDSHRYIPLGFKAMYARPVSQGPRGDFVHAYEKLKKWRLLRTCDGIKETIICIKPHK